ncbi:hypothetical protein N7507_002446 [Penicillium longicatenatum]|nr:hypothetical protein N7507_002446 [Penicillium longicatenatum]
MSVAFLADKTQSNITLLDLQNAAAGLGIQIQDAREAEDYLHLLQSAEAVMRQIQAEYDYIHPALSPVATIEPRKFSEPKREDNPLNAWRYRFEFVAQNPTSMIIRGKTITIKDNISTRPVHN